MTEGVEKKNNLKTMADICHFVFFVHAEHALKYWLCMLDMC
jgi:hypothetical protein